MFQIPLEVNDLVQVRILGEEPTSTYPSRVYDIVQQQIVIHWPSESGIAVPMRLEQQITIYFIREDAIYSFDAIVQGLHRDPVPGVSLLPSGAVQRIQRREYFRVRARLPVQLTEIAPDVESANHRRSRIKNLVTHTVNISGAGMAIHHGTPLPADAVFGTRLVMEEGKEPLKMISRVVHSEPVISSGEKRLYHVALVFISIKESQRRAIVRHLFKIQFECSIS